MRRRGSLILGLAACLVVLPRVHASTSVSGTVGVSATVTGSMSMVFVTDASGITLGGSGTSAVTFAFGTVQAYGGTVPIGVTETVNAPTNWTLTTLFDVNVELANLTSSNYTLTAQLQNADTTNLWVLNATTVTSQVPATLTSTGIYGIGIYSLHLTIPFSEAAGSIGNTLNFVATAN